MMQDIDIQIARALLRERGAPDVEMRARSRAQLLSYVCEPKRSAQTRRASTGLFAWRARFATWGVAAAAAAGVIVVATGGGSVVSPSPASAATILAKAANAVSSAMPADPGPGQYLFTKEIWVSAASDSSSSDAAGNPAPVEVTQAVDTWQNADGGVQTRETTKVNGTPVEPSKILYGNSQGTYRATRYGTVEGTIGLSSGGLGDFTYQQLEAMPTDVTSLRADLAQLANNGSAQSGRQAWINHAMFNEIHDILIQQLVPAKLRVALYQVAATIPGVTTLGQTKDAAGRSALVITFSDPLYNERDELLFDPATYLLTGESEVNTTTGQMQESQTIVQSQLVNQIPTALQSTAATAEASSRTTSG